MAVIAPLHEPASPAEEYYAAAEQAAVEEDDLWAGDAESGGVDHGVGYKPVVDRHGAQKKPQESDRRGEAAAQRQEVGAVETERTAQQIGPEIHGLPASEPDIDEHGDDAYWRHRFFCDLKQEEENGGKDYKRHQVADVP